MLYCRLRFSIVCRFILFDVFLPIQTSVIYRRVSALSGFMSVIFGNFHWGRLGECFLGSLLELGSERSVGVDYVIALYVAGTYWLVTGIQSG